MTRFVKLTNWVTFLSRVPKGLKYLVLLLLDLQKDVVVHLERDLPILFQAKHLLGLPSDVAAS